MLLFGLAACTASYSHLPPMAAAEIWAPLPVQRIEVSGVEIAYVDSGGVGPPLVFVHGLSSYLSFWEHQIAAFAGGYRVLALDLPGYGQSERVDAPCTPPWYAAVLADWMAAVGAPEAAVVGHSMGGQIALTLALEHPERVGALALSAPAGFETFDRGAAAFMKGFWHEERALETDEAALRAAFTGAVFNEAGAGVERLLEERVRMGRHPDFRGTSAAVSRSIAGMLDHPVYDRLGDIHAPTLIVFGAQDRMIPNPIFTGGRARQVAEAGRDAIPGAALVMVPGAGHTVHHDAPEAFNAALADFLGSL